MLSLAAMNVPAALGSVAAVILAAVFLFASADRDGEGEGDSE